MTEPGLVRHLPTDAELASVPRIGAQEAAIMVESGDATLVDTRYRGSYEGGHIDGAISVSPEEIEPTPSLLQLDAIPEEHKLILYCT